MNGSMDDDKNKNDDNSATAKAATTNRDDDDDDYCGTEKSGKRKRKLILHVDLRNTIIVADSVTNIDTEQAINSYLTGVLWGRVVDGRWTWVSRRPSLTPPEADTMTYYKYLERSTVTVPSDRAQLRLATGDFTGREIGAKFRPFFDKYLPMLRWKGGRESRPTNGSRGDHDDDSDDSGLEPETRCSRSLSSLESNRSDPPDDLLTTEVIRDNGSSERYHYIIPSFVKFLRRLYDQKRDFCLVIRTYGLDAPNVLSGIRRIVSGEAHPDFPTRRLMPFCTEVGRVSRFAQDGDHKTSVEMNFQLVRSLYDPCEGPLRTGTPAKRKRPSGSAEDDCGWPDKSPRKSIADLGGGLRVAKRRLHRNSEEPSRGHSFSDCNGSPSDSDSPPVDRQDSGHAETDSQSIAIGEEGDIVEVLNDLEKGVYAIVDDFSHWQSHGYSRLAAKPVWIALPRKVALRETSSAEAESTDHRQELGDCSSTRARARPPLHTSESHHHVFFDDNIRVSEEDSIVDVRLYDWKERRWRSSTRRETELCENVFLVQANLLESLENENYFSEKLEMCEKNLDRLLSSES